MVNLNVNYSPQLIRNFFLVKGCLSFLSIISSVVSFSWLLSGNRQHAVLFEKVRETTAALGDKHNDNKMDTGAWEPPDNLIYYNVFISNQKAHC